MAAAENLLEQTTGEMVGRYRLCFELASGGMATVFLARSPSNHGFTKVVALKRIHKHLAKHSDYVEMFLDEARIASRIDHPNVCHVLDFGESDGEYFMTMEYLVGEGLYTVLKQLVRHPERASFEDWLPVAVRALVDAAEGLHAAHELADATGEPLGIVHRDVSPQNLMLGFDGALRVVDFGIAKAADRLHETVTGEVKGKWSYMSPEQARSQRGLVDRRTDVWALGVVMWEVLTLRRLFKRPTSADTIYSVLEDEIDPPSRYQPKVPRALDAVALKALQRNQAERFSSTREFAQALIDAYPAAASASTAAALMKTLFPENEARKRQMIEVARVSDSIVPAAIPRRPDTGSFSGIAETLAGPEVDVSVPTSKSPWIAVALIALCAVGGAAWALMGDDTAPEVEAAAGAETEPEAEAEAEAEGEAEAVAETETETETQTETETETQTETETETETELAVAQMRRGMRRVSMMRAEAMTETVPTEMTEMVAQNGTLIVTTPGTWANVFLRGRLLGPTPLRRPLPPGTHPLELRFEGQPPGVRVQATVEAGQPTRIVQRR